MAEEGTVVLRRTWPQRLVILACLGVIASSIGAAFFVDDLYDGVADIGRVDFPGDLLAPDTSPGDPVNFLIIGLDSAEGLDPNDPAAFARIVDERGTHNADSISLLRVDPVGGQAWAMSIPRDLWVEVPGRSQRYKINATSLIEGAPLLVETVSDTFDVQINHYVELDFLAFRDVVDELGGVPMWFPFPARDTESALDVPQAGCVVLDGADALSFVRSRNYQEFRDGNWVDIGNADLGRIERQQQFVIVALDRAIARGARNPTTLAALIDSAAESVVLDQGLTPAELIDLAEAFTDFDSETLQTFSPAVVDVIEDGQWRGLGLAEDLDAEMFQIFRGVADATSRADVRFSVAGVDEATVVSDTELLRALDFSVGPERIIGSVGSANVIVYPTGGRDEAEVLARYVLPTPALVEDPSSAEMTLVLGTGHDGISFFFPQDAAETAAAIEAFGEVEIPSLAPAPSSSTTTTETATPSSTTEPPASTTTTTTTTTTVAPTTTTTTTTTVPLPGRPPEGESCG